MNKKKELKKRYEIIKLEFAAKIREETTKAGVGKIPKYLIEYLFRKLNLILDDIADELIDKAEPWLRSRYRKFKLWLRRRF